MFRMLVTLARGTAASAAQDVADRNALAILDQQIRDAAAGVEGGRRALALAIAHDDGEAKRLEATLGRIADLEERAVAALAGGRKDLALEAAEAIATLEADRDAITTARQEATHQIARLKTTVADAGRRLADLERGRRIAKAADAVHGLKTRCGIGLHEASLQEAETTLSRLRARQHEADAVETSLAALDVASGADTVTDRLEAAGFGKPTRPTAARVLERLQRSAPQTSATSN